MNTADLLLDHEAARVELANAARRAALRDYLLRLGADAELTPEGVVLVLRMPKDEDLGEWLAAWNTVNGEFAHVSAFVRADDSRVPPRLVTAPAPPRLGELLIAKGWITNAQLGDALVECRSTNSRLGRVLLRRGCIFEEELARTLAEQWSVPYVSLMRIGVDAAMARKLPQDLGLELFAIPVRRQEFGVQVAFADPSDREALDLVQMYVPSVVLAVAEYTDIETAWRQMRAS